MWRLEDALDELEDKKINCIVCKEDFIWTAGEQRYFKRHHLTHIPRRCKKCRSIKQERMPNGTERKKEYA